METVVPIPRLRRTTLGDDVYAAVTTLIMEHALAPGERVNIDELARQLEVSPTPVREALARLESDGLVRKRPLAGYTVSPLLTRQEFLDMFDMRLVLECAAARWAANRATAQMRASLLTAAATVPAPRTDADTGWQSHARFTAADAGFHDRIAVATGNPLLHDAIVRLHAHLHIHRLFFPHDSAGATAGEHQRIAEAIISRQPELAKTAMREHLDQAKERHLAIFT